MARAYGEGDRPGRVLANLVRPPKFSNYIAEIQDPEGVIHRNLPDELQTFVEFYKNLYTTQRGQPLDLPQYFEDTALA